MVRNVEAAVLLMVSGIKFSISNSISIVVLSMRTDAEVDAWTEFVGGVVVKPRCLVIVGGYNGTSSVSLTVDFVEFGDSQASTLS